MSRDSTVRKVELYDAVTPLSRPIADATHDIPEIRFVVVRLTLADGTVGEGHLLAFHYTPHGIVGALEDVAPLCLGLDASETGVLRLRADAQNEYFGNAGVLRWAVGVLDVAMWDAWGRHVGRPVHRLFGACRDRLPVYGSGGWLSYSLQELLEEVRGYVRRGFTSVKIKVGSSEPGRDVERIAKVREAVGPEVRLLIDANQGMDRISALALARAAVRHGVVMFEEPLDHRDWDGYAWLRRDAGIPLAMGEREYDQTPLRELIARGGIDLWQPDLLRLGGVAAWRSSAAVATAHHVPVLPHYYRDYDVALGCTVPGCRGCESFDWLDPLVDRPLKVEAGYAYPREEPGWGFSVLDRHLRPLGRGVSL